MDTAATFAVNPSVSLSKVSRRGQKRGSDPASVAEIDPVPTLLILMLRHSPLRALSKHLRACNSSGYLRVNKENQNKKMLDSDI